MNTHFLAPGASRLEGVNTYIQGFSIPSERDSPYSEGFLTSRGIPRIQRDPLPSSPHTHTRTKAHEGLTMNNHAHLELATFLLGFMLSKLTCFVEVIHGIA